MAYKVENDDVVELGYYRGKTMKMAYPCRHDFLQGFSRKRKCFWQQDVMEWALRFIPQNPCVVDVGSYVGNSAIWLAQVADARSVTAIEPDPLSFSLLEANVALNGMEDRIKLIHSAVWSDAGRAYLKADSITNHAAAQYRPCDPYNNAKWSVPMDKLDSLVAGRGDKVDLLLIDMEGYDYLAIRGAQQLISSDRPVLMLTTFNPTAKTVDPCYDSLQGHIKLMGDLVDLGYESVGKLFNTTVFLPTGKRAG